MNKSNKIYVAGHNGMVGSAIYSKLRDYGFKNIIVKSKKELNLRNQKDVMDFFSTERPEIIINAAARVGGILANNSYPYDFLMENMQIQNNLIDSALKFDVNKFIFLGSSCIYPKFSDQPIKENYLLTGSLEPTNEWYAIAKISGLKACEAIKKQLGKDFVCLMPTNLYGPNDNYHPQNSHVVASLIRKFLIAKLKNMPSVTCWGSGTVSREFMHVDDLAEAVIFCLENWFPDINNAPLDMDGHSLMHLNVGTGKDITINSLAEKIAAITDFKGEIIWDMSKPDGTPKKLLDINRIKKLGWEANIDLDNGIINFGDFLSIDTFKFLICIIIFFIIFTLISIFSFNRTNNFDSNYIRDTNLYPSLNTEYFKNILNTNDIDNKNLFDNDILKNILNENTISPGSHLILNIIKKLSKFFI